jgi:hypothetical protein
MEVKRRRRKAGQRMREERWRLATRTCCGA